MPEWMLLQQHGWGEHSLCTWLEQFVFRSEEEVGNGVKEKEKERERERKSKKKREM